jgi:hypothetical protein
MQFPNFSTITLYGTTSGIIGVCVTLVLLLGSIYAENQQLRSLLYRQEKSAYGGVARWASILIVVVNLMLIAAIWTGFAHIYTPTFIIQRGAPFVGFGMPVSFVVIAYALLDNKIQEYAVPVLGAILFVLTLFVTVGWITMIQFTFP